VPIATRAAQIWGIDGWQTAQGAYVVEVGRSVEDMRLTAELDVP
jgi:hypothetical protein